MKERRLSRRGYRRPGYGGALSDKAAVPECSISPICRSLGLSVCVELEVLCLTREFASLLGLQLTCKLRNLELRKFQLTGEVFKIRNASVNGKQMQRVKDDEAQKLDKQGWYVHPEDRERDY